MRFGSTKQCLKRVSKTIEQKQPQLVWLRIDRRLSMETESTFNYWLEPDTSKFILSEVVSGRAVRDLDHNSANNFGFEVLKE